VRLALAPLQMKADLRQLLDEYLLEFAGMEGRSATRETHGHVRYRYFDQYWFEPERFPFGIWVEGDVCGFCLLRVSGGAVEPRRVLRPARASQSGSRSPPRSEHSWSSVGKTVGTNPSKQARCDSIQVQLLSGVRRASKRWLRAPSD